jgi:transcription elongation factor GreA
MNQATATIAMDPQELRSRVASILERMSARMFRRMARLSELDAVKDTTQDAVVRTLQARVAELGQLAAGLTIVDASCLPAQGAGFGSRVRVQHVDSGDEAEYMLMVGSLVDIDADQVSLASPIGQALIGREPGDLISIVTPQGPMQLRVTGLETIADALDAQELSDERE